MGWVYGNRYLSEKEKAQNVQECEAVFVAAGWSLNARCAMYGNMDVESNINPAIYQYLNANIKNGYGIVQWTPASKIQNWLKQNGYAITDGTGECKRILWELANGQQWISTTKYPQSFSQFTTSNLSISDLTEMWMRNYERPKLATANLPERIKRANKWYTYLTSENPPEPEEPDNPDNPYFPDIGIKDLQRKKAMLIMITGKRLRG